MAHAAALAHGTSDLPTQVAAAAEPALVAAAARLDPPRLRRVLGHLQDDARSGDQRRADALVELARRALVGGQLPRAAGSDPNSVVIVDWTACSAAPGRWAARRAGPGPGPRRPVGGWPVTAPSPAVLVSRAATHQPQPGGDPGPATSTRAERWAGRAAAGRPDPAAPSLGGAPRQPLDAGRASRVITPAQRSALAVGDGGCVFPDCDRPWPDARATIWSTGWMVAHRPGQSGPAVPGPSPGRP